MKRCTRRQRRPPFSSAQPAIRRYNSNPLAEDHPPDNRRRNQQSVGAAFPRIPSANSAMPLTTKTAHVTAEQTGRVDRVVQSLTTLSHRKMAGLFDHGCVTVNGRPCDHAGKRVKAGDRVEVCYDPHQGYREKKKKWADRAFSIVYE